MLVKLFLILNFLPMWNYPRLPHGLKTPPSYAVGNKPNQVAALLEQNY